MEIKAKTRDEVEEKYKWDLSTIYTNEELWEQDFQKVSKMIPLYEFHDQKFLDNAQALLELLEFDETVERIIGKLYCYAHKSYDVDTTNIKYQEMNGRINDLLVKARRSTSFIEPRILECDYDLIEKYYEELPQLREYELILKKIFRYKNHVLSKEQEKIVSSMEKILGAPQNIYEILTDGDLKFGYIQDEDENKVELTDSNYGIYIASRDRSVRKNVFKQLYKVYGNYKNSIAYMLASDIESRKVLAHLRGFSSSLEASIYPDEVEKNIYDNLIETVHRGLPSLHKYYKLKKDLLGLDEFHLYDAYTHLTEGSYHKYSFEKGQRLVTDALCVLGDQYIEILDKAFTEKWIDVCANTGKRGGAYSGGNYDTKPFILLNYEETLNNVSTLAHELGHSMHSYLTRKTQPYQSGNYQIFVAEVASTVNELLLYHHMLKNSVDREEKLTIINSLLELYKGTIYRQTMFAEFEKMISEKSENGEVLTNELLCNTYYELNQLYFGKDVVVDEEIKYEWIRVPHFYYNFYVYKYAIGLSCASHIVKNILEEKENALENYLKFLSSGSIASPLELLKQTGCDLTKPDVTESAIQMFDSLLDQFIEIYNQ